MAKKVGGRPIDAAAADLRQIFSEAQDSAPPARKSFEQGEATGDLEFGASATGAASQLPLERDFLDSDSARYVGMVSRAISGKPLAPRTPETLEEWKSMRATNRVLAEIAHKTRPRSTLSDAKRAAQNRREEERKGRQRQTASGDTDGILFDTTTGGSEVELERNGLDIIAKQMRDANKT